MHAGHSGDIAWRSIEPKYRPPLCDGPITTPCDEPWRRDRIEIKFDPSKVGRQADAESFDPRPLEGPQDKECIPPGGSLQSGEEPAFRRFEIAFRNRHCPRHIMHPLDVDADRVIESHREHAAIAAVRDAELKVGSIRRLN